jgi:CO/xanthine dehydrogenase FAD-binding subunit
MGLEIVRVDSVRAAAAILAAETGARFLGGGTLAVRDVNYGNGSIAKLVLPEGLGLDRIEVEGNEIILGAAVTMAKIAAHPRLGFLAPVAGAIGGPAVRAMATVGGNLFAPYPFGDFTAALLALGAAVTVEGTDKTEIVDLDTFLAKGNPAASVVRSVAFTAPPAGAFRFAKVVRRKPHGASVLSIAAMLPMADRKVAGGRIAYGAMSPKPMRSRAVEKALEGKPLDAANIAMAIKVATVGCKPQTDAQASEWYRMAVLPVHLQRLLGA